ncbi:dehydration-responsive element-binding protein 1A-like [Panicum miliaceum]|uniref:Dehydration-responsive element-binding protein 1A-like n=1 Tax=Panicum miliaceum TaxID=4540 RepID=A0A3L6TH47_PANMI|nr:dehydration-responsive element-binding protein 1A-like [Panicum miliaceum]
MCPIKEMIGQSATPCSSASTSSEHHQTCGRRRRGGPRGGQNSGRRRGTPCSAACNAGRWVCDVRVPGRRGCRLWLGTFGAAMLAIAGAGACLNFADSAWLLPVPASYASLADVRRAVAEAVEDFQRHEALLEEDAQSATSSTPSDEGSSTDGEDSSLATEDSLIELDCSTT